MIVIKTKQFRLKFWKHNKQTYGTDCFDNMLWLGWFIFCWG